MSGRNCPECGTPRGADGAPDCACAQRASDAARDVRSAEAAAAEDFDPLRIRPYVSLPDAEPAPDAEPQEPPTQVVPAVYAGPAEPPREGDLDLFAGAPDA
ncbi:peptidoglycan-binding protein, partial [Streptomyces sp. T-3]|nr:peptidoglycan-binding protein [Streptomyces sp. T-3]